MIDENELLFDELYEKTKDCGRIQFIKLLMEKERENKELKNQLEQCKAVADTNEELAEHYKNKTDKATYEMYKDSDDPEKQSWAENAKMRANKTANVFNEYMLKNSYVFDGNIPEDINFQLEILE